MAIIKLQAPIAGIRGTIGGLTYSANASSLFVKAWARGSNPRTPKQSLERSYLAQMPLLWNLLNDSERALWRTFASDPAQELTNSLGQTYFASGYNWFVKCNIRLLRVNRSTISAIPTAARPAAPTLSHFNITVAGSNPDLASGGTASASTNHPDRPPEDAFDDDPTTYWTTTFGTTTGWIQYIMPSSHVVRSYSIYLQGSIDAAPKTWTFERLDPGPTWVPIDSQTDILIGTDITHHFYCENSTPSTTYRLNITENNGSTDRLQINEVQFFDDKAGASQIIYPITTYIYPPYYDLILKISQGQTTSRNVMYPGFREILALSNPAETIEPFQTELTNSFGTIQENRSWFARLYRQTDEGLRSSPTTAKAITI